MLHYFLIGLGGCFGSMARFLVQQWATQRWGADFPYGTLLANVSGSFIIGFFFTLAAGRLSISVEARLLVATGFLGGFTTFSSFSYETFRLSQQSGWWIAGLNFVSNTGLSLLGVALGVLLARLILE